MANVINQQDAAARDLEARERRWLAAHGTEYAGQWVALDGDRLLCHGADARSVYAEARRKATGSIPLVVRLEAQTELPFGGW